ncbi:hypothetical protein [Nocardia sp. NPDC051570]|uniref:hypothetical protein n=1 Tax=Nocardia sp. NPDC051570 TaxID=3364324 RepID=UPI0037A7A7FF
MNLSKIVSIAIATGALATVAAYPAIAQGDDSTSKGPRATAYLCEKLVMKDVDHVPSSVEYTGEKATVVIWNAVGINCDPLGSSPKTGASKGFVEGKTVEMVDKNGKTVRKLSRITFFCKLDAGDGNGAVTGDDCRLSPATAEELAPS